MEISELPEETGRLATLKLALTDWEKKPKVKLFLIGLMWLLVFLRLFPLSLFFTPLLIFFPVGFMNYLPSSMSRTVAEIVSVTLGWAAYFLITTLILLFKNKLVVRSLFLLLAILLLFNISGCGELGKGFG